MEGLIFGGAYLRREIDWASLIVGSKFTVFALFYFVFEGNFQVQAPGGLYLEGRFNGGFLCYEFGGLMFGGAYTWRGLFSEFTVSYRKNKYGYLHSNQQRHDGISSPLWVQYYMNMFGCL